ncbi:hypothetical protein C2G38_2208850 [Gigaspora rosea]|uniref:Uncharacterized protein n=1 Tax=Gigaspora rosea TaxID=44941 RepID=A0A397UH78_9GLOM|nr:hypothetical protein C2G38_2208850 [Gigaspora rosea]
MIYQLILLPPEFTEIEDRIRSINRQNYQELDNDTEIFNITCFHYFQYLNYIDNQLNSIQKLNGGYKEILKEEDITEYFLTIFVNFDHHEFQSCCYTTYVSQIINNPNKITKQDANFIFDLAKRLVLPKEYKLLEKIINSVKSENRYQVAISLIVDTENGFVLRRQILADQYLDEFLRKKLMDQFDEKIIPICLNIEQDQPQLYPQEYFQINNLIDTIVFKNYQDLQINIADHEQDLLELRNELSNDKILLSDLKNNLIQMIDKRIADDFDL